MTRRRDLSGRVREMLIKPLIPAGLLAALFATQAGAENLEAGKSAAALFGLNCAVCHSSPHELTKDVDPNSLADFLRQHYTSSPETASEMAAYLNGLTGGPHRATSKQPGHESDGPGVAPAATPVRHGSQDGSTQSDAAEDHAGASAAKRRHAEDGQDDANRSEHSRTRSSKHQEQPASGSPLEETGRDEATRDESARPPAGLPFAGPPADATEPRRRTALPTTGDDVDPHFAGRRESRGAAHAGRTATGDPKGDSKGDQKDDQKADSKADLGDATPSDPSQRRHHGKAAHRDSEPAGESDAPRRSHSARIPSGGEAPAAKPSAPAILPNSPQAPDSAGPRAKDSTAAAPSVGAAGSPAAGLPAAGPANQTTANPSSADQPTFSAPSP
jgi:hypothetical protein